MLLRIQFTVSRLSQEKTVIYINEYYSFNVIGTHLLILLCNWFELWNNKAYNKIINFNIIERNVIFSQAYYWKQSKGIHSSCLDHFLWYLKFYKAHLTGLYWVFLSVVKRCFNIPKTYWHGILKNMVNKLFWIWCISFIQ